MHYHKLGQKFMQTLDDKFGDRISIYHIKMDNWSNSALKDWNTNVNGRNAIPSFHFYKDSKLDEKMRGPPATTKIKKLVWNYLNKAYR